MKRKYKILLKQNSKLIKMVYKMVTYNMRADDGGEDMPPAPEIPGLAIRAEDSLRHYR